MYLCNRGDSLFIEIYYTQYLVITIIRFCLKNNIHLTQRFYYDL